MKLQLKHQPPIETDVSSCYRKSRRFLSAEVESLREEKPLFTHCFFRLFLPREREREELFPECFPSLSPLLSTQVSLNLKLWLARCFRLSFFFHASLECVSNISVANLTSEQILRRFKTTVLLQLIPQTRLSGHNSTQFRYPSLYPFRRRWWWWQVKWKTAQNTCTEWSHVISSSYLHHTLSSSLWTHSRKKG